MTLLNGILAKQLHLLTSNVRHQARTDIHYLNQSETTNNMKTRKLRSLKTGKVAEFKAYAVGDIPPSFDKNKNLHFSQGGLTYIEKVDSIWNYV
jgi:hypothetical protein